VAAARVIGPDHAHGIGLRAGADALGALLVTGGLMLGVATVVGTASYGWLSGRTLGTAAAAAALLAAFGWRQAAAAHPLLPLRVFRSRDLSVGNIVQALMVAGMLGFQFILPLYLRRVLGYDPAETGLAFLPITVVIAGVSVAVAPRLNTRFGPRAVVLASLPMLAVGLALLTRAGDQERFGTGLLPVLVLLGVGAGLALPAVMMLVMSAVSQEDSGVVSGLANTTQQVGGAVGVAVLAALATRRTGLLLASGHPPAVALTAGYHLAFGVGAASVAAAFGAALTLSRPGPTARRLRAARPTRRTPAGQTTDSGPGGPTGRDRAGRR
jgi:predicted MFS family arabinose efflux permease